MARKKIPIISLFCGCGGMDLGFRQLGFEPLIAIDNDQTAVDTYNKNHRAGIAQTGDLSLLSGRDIIHLIEKSGNGVRPRGVIGGPPCQSFSLSNVHENDKDPRHALPLYYAKILAALNKKYHLDFFVFENVVGLKSKKHRRRFSKILRALEGAGFNVFEHVINASWFGVPQLRRRIFVVGINKELYPHAEFIFPPNCQIPTKTVHDAIAGLPEPAFFNRTLTRVEIPFHPNHWTMQPKSPKFIQRSGGENGRSFRRLQWEKPSWTVAYGHREIHVHPNGKRRLSIFEAMRLQSFPDKYELTGNLSQQVKQVSDAVPPPMANAIAKAMHKSIYNRHRIESHSNKRCPRMELGNS
jgi:DNA (cytosine-5)-methyltransferase 1